MVKGVEKAGRKRLLSLKLKGEEKTIVNKGGKKFPSSRNNIFKGSKEKKKKTLGRFEATEKQAVWPGVVRLEDLAGARSVKVLQGVTKSFSFIFIAMEGQQRILSSIWEGQRLIYNLKRLLLLGTWKTDCIFLVDYVENMIEGAK